MATVGIKLLRVACVIWRWSSCKVIQAGDWPAVSSRECRPNCRVCRWASSVQERLMFSEVRRPQVWPSTTLLPSPWQRPNSATHVGRVWNER